MSTFLPVQTRRAFEAAVEQIAERISIGELAPGDQLPPERTLAQQMEISRWGPTRGSRHASLWGVAHRVANMAA